MPKGGAGILAGSAA